MGLCYHCLLYFTDERSEHKFNRLIISGDINLDKSEDTGEQNKLTIDISQPSTGVMKKQDEDQVMETKDQEYVPLPDMNDNLCPDRHYGGDSTLWDHDDFTPPSDEELVPNTTPFYANQLDDPEVDRAYNDYLDKLFG